MDGFARNHGKVATEVHPRTNQDSAAHNPGGRIIGKRKLERGRSDPLAEWTQHLRATDKLHILNFAAGRKDYTQVGTAVANP